MGARRGVGHTTELLNCVFSSSFSVVLSHALSKKMLLHRFRSSGNDTSPCLIRGNSNTLGSLGFVVIVGPTWGHFGVKLGSLWLKTICAG